MGIIEEVIYTIGKVYFVLAGPFYVYSYYTNSLDFFAHVTGIMAILFLLSNIKYYMFNKH
ncbi:MAG TPA: hypothetical protein VJI12_01470 [archaeon]|nr:hypothetical protein [archaeon]